MFVNSGFFRYELYDIDYIYVIIFLVLVVFVVDGFFK